MHDKLNPVQNWWARHINIPRILSILLFLIGGYSIILGLSPFLAVVFLSDGHNMLYNIIQAEGKYKVHTGLFLVFGYVLIILSRGLYQSRYLAWLLSLILLAVLFLNNTTLLPRSTFLSVLYVLECVGLIYYRRYFNQKSKMLSLSFSHVLIIVSVVMVFLYGILGSYLLKAHFVGIDNWVDAVYFTFVTYSTVGYGDITPHNSFGRVFVITMILFGLGVFSAVLTYVFSAIATHVKTLLTANQGGQKMNNHMIICGLNSLALNVIGQLPPKSTSLLIMSKDVEPLSSYTANKWKFVEGLATCQSNLQKAEILQAKTILIDHICDADNILILLNIQAEAKLGHVLPDVKIIVHIHDVENIEKAKKLGAHKIISPYQTAASQVIKTALK